MARYELYEIRTARNAAAEADGDGRPLYRRSFVCAEREDVSLFAWLDGEHVLQAFQLLFREHFVVWSRSHGLEVGVTSRHDINPFAEPRQRGVRTLHGRAHEEVDRILSAARALLARTDLPPAVDAGVRAALAADD